MGRALLTVLMLLEIALGGGCGRIYPHALPSQPDKDSYAVVYRDRVEVVLDSIAYVFRKDATSEPQPPGRRNRPPKTPQRRLPR